MRFPILFLILCSVFISMTVFAGDGGAPDAAIAGESTDVGDIITGVGNIVEKVKEYKGAEEAGKLMGLMALLAAIFKLSMSGLKLTSKVFFKSDKGKNILKIITLLLGVGTFLVSSMAIGKTWWESLILAMSGPMSMVVHELTKLVPAIRKAKS